MLKDIKLEVVSVNQHSIAMLNHTLHLYIQRKSKNLQNKKVEEGEEFVMDIRKKDDNSE